MKAKASAQKQSQPRPTQKRGRSISLSDSEFGVLIGFRGSQRLKNELEASAASLGIGYSQLLRIASQDVVEKIRQLCSDATK